MRASDLHLLPDFAGLILPDFDDQFAVNLTFNA